MIRRKVSNGLLRAATQVQSASGVSASSSAAHAVNSSPMQQQTANLASAVLLSSQRNWKGETVVTLKNELKKRGLSQSGNKATLIARLASADTSQLLPPMPKRALSTSPSTAAAASKKGPTTPSKPEDTATSHTEKEMTTGPEISSKRAEAEPLEKPTKEQVTVAPGLPESGKVESSSGDQLSMKMPNPTADGPSKEQVIPLTPDNFRSNDQIPEASAEADKSKDVPSPKVLTVASASTHLSGGPVSAVHESGDSAQIDEHDTDLGGLTPNFQGAGQALASAVNSFTGMSKTAGEFSRVLVPEIGLPKSDGGKGEDYKPPSGGMSDEERKGLWVLGGIVGLGLLLGGSGRDKKGSALGSKVGSAVDAVKGAGSGPKGDVQWEKASGAGVVGHGSRKE